jgi:MFS family permease
MAGESGRRGWSVFRHRDFAFYCGARFLSATAIQMQTVAVSWLVYDLTGSALALGLVGLFAFLPAAGLVLVSGLVADRRDRRVILIVCYALTTAAALGLLLLTWTGPRSVWPIYGLIVILGTARAFANPAGQALLPNLVPREELTLAVTWNSSAWQTAIILGPALGGILYGVGGTLAFAVATALFVVTLALLVAIRHRAQARPATPAGWADLVGGIRFIRSKRIILGAITLDLFAVLLGGATALLPIYARDILAVGAAGLGVLRSMPAIGAVSMAALLAVRPLKRRTGARMFQAVGVFGLATIGLGFSASFTAALICLFVLGAADMISVVIRHTLIQIETGDDMRGRVASVNSVFIGASNELGEFESGLVAHLIGTAPAVVAGGIGTLVVAVLCAKWFPELRHRDRLVA